MFSTCSRVKQLHCWYGYQLAKTEITTSNLGLSGLEYADAFLDGQNADSKSAGTHGSDVSRINDSAEIVLGTGKLVSFMAYMAEPMQLAYRHSVLHKMRTLSRRQRSARKHREWGNQGLAGSE
ncbi:hypothetical protein [Paenibacillus alvei]|uniref:Uncharacterized protein n=2 Tax=Paenibacillus alvei TaxID=44250 RepID=A0AAP7DGQ8_PAEAL|nr:hypothetical protein [Paenibacillus alvei]MCY9587111.1 hypothetical protein [Paenibacillus alvei]NEZ40869.1 hypothetical protein [Paenibacillus alvei]NOJ69683.1 hypothetical protein [Paenibacillus alvei]